MILKQSSQRRGIRKSVYLPLVGIVAAGAVSAGMGGGVAAADTDANSSGTTEWRVHNATDQTLTGGTVYKFDQGSYLASVDVAGMNPGDVKYSTYLSAGGANLTSATGICYNGSSWHFGAKTPHEKWRDVYIFASADGGLFVTPEGAHDDQPMTPTGPC